MKKKVLSATLIPIMLFVGLLQTGCFGEFVLTKKLYTWNSELGDKSTLGGRFVNNIVFWAFLIVPVYDVVVFIDAIINIIEFWTGTNPLAMQEGDMEQQYVSYRGKDYLITATKNQFKVEELKDGVVVEETLLQYCEDDMSWSAVRDGESYMLAAFRGMDDKGASFDIFTTEGVKTVSVDPGKLGNNI